MREEIYRASFATGPHKLKHFNRVVTERLLLIFVLTNGWDEKLWSYFTHQFRQCKKVTAEKRNKPP
jgi:hypothetical protein